MRISVRALVCGSRGSPEPSICSRPPACLADVRNVIVGRLRFASPSARSEDLPLRWAKHPCCNASIAETGSECDSPRHMRVCRDIVYETKCDARWRVRQGEAWLGWRWKQTGMFDMQDIPETGFLRLSQVLSVIPLGKTCWWEGVRSGRFPKPVKLSARCTAWRAEDIRELINTLSDPGSRETD